MVKDVETATRNVARGALRAFLEGKKSLAWVIGLIRSAGVRDERLREVFENLKVCGNPARYYEALAACREQGWLQ